MYFYNNSTHFHMITFTGRGFPTPRPIFLAFSGGSSDKSVRGVTCVCCHGTQQTSLTHVNSTIVWCSKASTIYSCSRLQVRNSLHENISNLQENIHFYMNFTRVITFTSRGFPTPNPTFLTLSWVRANQCVGGITCVRCHGTHQTSLTRVNYSIQWRLKFPTIDSCSQLHALVITYMILVMGYKIINHLHKTGFPHSKTHYPGIVGS